MKKIIIQKINSGEYLPEQSLPGERVLMKQTDFEEETLLHINERSTITSWNNPRPIGRGEIERNHPQEI
jgi:hypothetical protein